MPALPSTIQTDIPPGYIDLGAGFPSADLLPVELMQRATQHRFASGERNYLQYGLEAGAPALRQQLAQLLAERYIDPAGKPLAIDYDGIFISNGVSQALELICALFTAPGDTIVVEEPTYFLALRIFADRGLRILSVPTDADGMRIDLLESLLRSERPRLLYTIPTYQNPSGVTLSHARRAQLIELAHRHDFLILADEVYHILGFDNTPPPPPLAAWSHTPHVLSLGSFSKILAPGLRLGWVQGHESHLRVMVNSGVLDSGGGLNPFTGAMVQSALELNLLAPWIDNLRAIYAARSRSLADAVRQYLPEAEFTVPGGGYFLWLRLPGVDALRLKSIADEAQVGFRAGIHFAPASEMIDYLRLCHAFYTEEELAEGVERLAYAVATYLSAQKGQPQ